jgi:hypothetical protein
MVLRGVGPPELRPKDAVGERNDPEILRKELQFGFLSSL